MESAIQSSLQERRIKSTITCDMEGIIETYNDGARALFGYQPEEVVGIKRVSYFSPGWIVLQNVETWLKTARETGEFKSKTIFVRKDGSTFNAEVRITPTYKGKQQIGYCGVTTEIDEPVHPVKHWWISLVIGLVITRAPFLSASVIPAFIAGAFALSYTDQPVFSSLNFIIAATGVAILHLASNVYNDYFDWDSGTDQANKNYFLKYSGGSRSIELGLISHKGTFVLATTLLAVSTAMGLYLWQSVGSGILVFGLAGAAAGYFYTAPPLRLVARHGLGEIVIGVTFGPLITGGVFYAVTGLYSWESLLIGLPVGLLTSNILLINQVPDMEGDAATGKNHLVVTYGKERSVNFYSGILGGALLSSILIAFLLQKPYVLISSAVLAFYGMYIIRYFKAHLYKRELVHANVHTIYLSMVAGILFAVGIGM